MAKVAITTNAIKNIISNPSKLKQFRTVEDHKKTDEYVKFLSTSVFTLTAMKENAQKFARFNQLSEKSQADFGYLVQLLADIKNKGIAFRLLPIVELYESLLEENWKNVSYEREVLNATESFDYTADSNMEICHSIVRFLKEYVLNKNHTETHGI